MRGGIAVRSGSSFRPGELILGTLLCRRGFLESVNLFCSVDLLRHNHSFFAQEIDARCGRAAIGELPGLKHRALNSRAPEDYRPCIMPVGMPVSQFLGVFQGFSLRDSSV